MEILVLFKQKFKVVAFKASSNFADTRSIKTINEEFYRFLFYLNFSLIVEFKNRIINIL